MATRSNERKQRNRELRAALAFFGMTERKYAAKVGVTPVHLSLVLNGKRISPRIDNEAARLITKFREKMCNDSPVQEAA